MKQYVQALRPGGRLILTGILTGTAQADAGEQVAWDSPSGRENLVMAALEREGLRLIRREQDGDWVLLEASKP
jgi:ribosomal protein L11 methylase PrmA